MVRSGASLRNYFDSLHHHFPPGLWRVFSGFRIHHYVVEPWFYAGRTTPNQGEPILGGLAFHSGAAVVSRLGCRGKSTGVNSPRKIKTEFSFLYRVCSRYASCELRRLRLSVFFILSFFLWRKEFGANTAYFDCLFISLRSRASWRCASSASRSFRRKSYSRLEWKLLCHKWFLKSNTLGRNLRNTPLIIRPSQWILILRWSTAPNRLI